MDLESNGWRLIRQSQIDGDFEGFDDEMIFTLEDGTHWYQSSYKYAYHYAYCPRAKIYEKGSTRIIVVDGFNDYAEVQETSAIKSRIINDFKGWTGDTVFELENGQIWKQDKYQYKYFYAHRPRVIIVKIGSKHIMQVKGRSIRVKKIK